MVNFTVFSIDGWHSAVTTNNNVQSWLSIIENNINLTYPNRTIYGFNINETTNTPNYYLISNNVLQHCYRGIYMVGVQANAQYPVTLDENQVLTDNTIPAFSHIGIYESECANIINSCNLVDNQTQPYTSNSYGFYINHTKGNFYYGNIAHRFAVGMGFQGDCNPSYLEATYFNTNVVGMLLNNGSTNTVPPFIIPGNIGQQGGINVTPINSKNWSNKWNFGFLPPGFMATRSINSNVPNFNFATKTAGTIYNPIPNATFYTHVGTGNAYICNPSVADDASEATCDITTTVYDRMETQNEDTAGIWQVAEQLIVDSIYATETAANIVFNSRLELYKNVVTNSAILHQYPALQDFVNEFQSKAEGANYEIMQLLNASFDSTIAQMEPEQRAHLQEQYLNQARNLNFGINDTTTAAQYLKAVTDLQLISLNDSFINFDSTQLGILNSIAPLCPNEFGAAVYNARTLLMLNGDYTEYDDLQLCSNNGNRTNGDETSDEYLLGANISDINKNYDEWEATQSSKPTIAILQPHLAISPNPTDAMVTMQYDNLPSSAMITITNIMGETVLTQAVKNENGKINIATSSFGNGIYFIKIANGQQMLLNHKLVVIH